MPGKLEQTFKRYQDYPFLMVEPSGNQGDGMIYQGAYKLADRVGLKYSAWKASKNVPELPLDTVIYLHGGGGFNAWWGWTPRVLAELCRVNPHNLVIVGPTTVAKQPWFLNRHLPRHDKLVFFARERVTYNYMREQYDYITYIDHDTSLHLEYGDKYLGKLLGEDQTLGEEHSLFVLREGPESPDTLPEEIDLEGYDYVLDPCKTDRWGWYHLKASEIASTRSHSGVLGMLLGKPTTMLPNSYHKNKSIYEYSLKERDVKWIE